ASCYIEPVKPAEPFHREVCRRGIEYLLYPGDTAPWLEIKAIWALCDTRSVDVCRMALTVEIS
ncbi:MAG TPA: hypothetical protein PK183_11130, partial [Bacillota bacterium]|nr:hypothetical protein [Bacillota bacterium]